MPQKVNAILPPTEAFDTWSWPSQVQLTPPLHVQSTTLQEFAEQIIMSSKAEVTTTTSFTVSDARHAIDTSNANESGDAESE